MNWGIRRQSVLGLCVVAALVLFVGLWGTFASLAGAVIAPGQIELKGRSQVVQHPDGGTVSRIRVKDGDSVDAEEVLLELDGSTLRSQLAIVGTQLVELTGEIARLTAEQANSPKIIFPDDITVTARTDPTAAEVIRRQVSMFEARHSTFTETIRGLREQQNQKRSEIDGLTARATALSDQLGLIENELTDARSLQKKGLMPDSRVFELERTARGLEGEIAGSKASAASAGSEIAGLDVEVQRLTAARQEEIASGLRDAESKYRELDEQDHELSRRIDRLNLRAPRAGIVHGLQVHALGAVIKPADPVLYVIPQDDQLTVTAKVDAAHVDAVYAGQVAMMRFTSFDARTTPELRGSVLRVSADTTTDNRTGATYYTVEIGLDAAELDKLDGKALLPGMPVEVYIQTGSRSPLRYILKPFLDYVERAGKD